MNHIKRNLFLFLACILLMNAFPLGALATEDNTLIDIGQGEVITEETIEEPAIAEEPKPTPEATEISVAFSLSEGEIVPVGVMAETSELSVEDEIVETESPQEDAATESAEDLTGADTPAEASDSTEEDTEETPATYTK